MFRARWVSRSTRLISVAVVAAAPVVFAQTLNVKLGLWETTMVAQTSGVPPLDMSNMTPEQRARMEAAMEAAKKRAATPHTFRTCLTKEKLDKAPFQDKDNDASCKHTVITRSTTVYAVKFECSRENNNSSGEWRFEAVTPENVKGGGKFTVESAGRKMSSTGTMNAKWIGASCGDVK